MKNRIDLKFKKLRRERKKAFIAYITAGDPDLGTTGKLVKALEASGVDILELGIPFSDPLADGPTIQAASQRALKKGVSLSRIMRFVGGIRKDVGMPIVFMTYYNPVLQYGLARFMKDCRKNGVDGVIVPDLPYEESKDLISSARKYDIATIFLVAPTSTVQRISKISKVSKGFIYYVSLTGVTGARRDLPPEMRSKVRCVKSVSSLPVCVGFGISNPAQAKQVAKIANGIIIGSAIVDVIGKNGKNRKKLIGKVSSFARKIAKAIHGE